MQKHDIVVIGASAGGIEVLTTLLRVLPATLPAAIFVVLHRAASSPSILINILDRASVMKVVEPADRDSIQHGTIYVAPADHHLLIEDNHVRVIRGPKENRHRPAVDPLFRSAAVTYGPRVIGIIMTGALDDGTAGLQTIKQQGGLAIVQDPEDALFPSMPMNAMEYVQVDYCVNAVDIGPLLGRLVNESVEDEATQPISEETMHEVGIAKMEKDAFAHDELTGEPSVYSCPECGGVLWELNDDQILRFRCRVGHAFSLESMQEAQSDQIEDALWSALKTLQESASLSERMATQARKRGQHWLEKTLKERATTATRRADVISEVLVNGLASNGKKGHVN